MAIDYISLKDLTSSLISGDIENLISFTGYLLLVGTILGIIIDGIHHSILEDWIYDSILRKHIGIGGNTNQLRESCFNKCKTDSYISNDDLTRHFFFKKLNGTAINQYLIEEFYCYSEFYANTFLALIPFTFILPPYLTNVLEIPSTYSRWIYLISVITIITCFISSYVAYNRYNKALFSAILGYIETQPMVDSIEIVEKCPSKEITEEIKPGTKDNKLSPTDKDKAIHTYNEIKHLMDKCVDKETNNDTALEKLKTMRTMIEACTNQDMPAEKQTIKRSIAGTETTTTKK